MTEKKIPKNPFENAENLSEEDVVAGLASFWGGLAKMFGEGAGMLSQISDCLKEDSDPSHMEDSEGPDDTEKDDTGHMGAAVLYAVPGAPVQLMTEKDALLKFSGLSQEQTFHCFEILEHLYLNYTGYSLESEDDITITDPVLVARVNDDETETVELSARDLIAAIAFLNDHMVTLVDKTGDTGCGYWLPKEED